MARKHIKGRRIVHDYELCAMVKTAQGGDLKARTNLVSKLVACRQSQRELVQSLLSTYNVSLVPKHCSLSPIYMFTLPVHCPFCTAKPVLQTAHIVASLSHWLQFVGHVPVTAGVFFLLIDSINSTCGDRIILVQHSQYHGCWGPGSLRRQDISTNDIYYVD